MLSLALREAEIVEDCITSQGIRLNVRAVAAFKVGDDPVSIANAARRFLSEQDRMEELVGRIFAGHLRSIIGGLTVEQIIRERDRVAQEVKDGSHAEMEKLGIVVDALQIQEIEDASGYINNLAAPHAAAVASQARIAQAKADQEAAEREQEAAGAEGAVRAGHRDQAGRLPGRDRAGQGRGGAGRPAGRGAGLPGGHRAADRARPAPGRAGRPAPGGRGPPPGRRRGLPDSARWPRPSATRPSSRPRARPTAAPRWPTPRPRRSGSGRTAPRTPSGPPPRRRPTPTTPGPPRSDGNQELIAANRLIENLPALVEAAARGIAGSNLTVLNGTEGVNEVVAGLVGQGLSILDTLKKSTAVAGHGASRHAAPVPVTAVADGRLAVDAS